jgi:hypothetical protein
MYNNPITIISIKCSIKHEIIFSESLKLIAVGFKYNLESTQDIQITAYETKLNISYNFVKTEANQTCSFVYT